MVFENVEVACIVLVLLAIVEESKKILVESIDLTFTIRFSVVRGIGEVQ